jgi:hypothetical protein
MCRTATKDVLLALGFFRDAEHSVPWHGLRQRRRVGCREGAVRKERLEAAEVEMTAAVLAHPQFAGVGHL